MKTDKVRELVEQLDQYETYDKENLLIDIYVSLIEEKYDIDDTLFAFIELSTLRDATLAEFDCAGRNTLRPHRLLIEFLFF